MIIKNCKCFTGERFLDGLKDIIIQNDVVSEIIDHKEYSGPDTIDAQSGIVCPGYVDIHTHDVVK